MKIFHKISDEIKIVAFSILIVPACFVYKVYRKYFRKRRRFRKDWCDYENY